MRCSLLALILLAACGRENPVPVIPAVSFRDQNAPIASTTRDGTGILADSVWMAGDWTVSAAFPGIVGNTVVQPGGTWRVGHSPHGRQRPLTWFYAPPSGESEHRFLTDMSGPGRHEIYFLSGAELQSEVEIWILWVDDDFRTAVVGTPDGRFGWIMDRPGEASPDRTRAAREVLDFNGYDLSRLEP